MQETKAHLSAVSGKWLDKSIQEKCSKAKTPFSRSLSPFLQAQGCKAPPLSKHRGWDVLEPALAALTAGSNSILPHPQALGHNDQVSLHQVCGPTLPCLPAHGKSLSPERKATPDAACLLVRHQGSHTATRRWLEPGPACRNTDPLPPPTCMHSHTQHAQMNPSLQLCPGLGTSARFTRSNATGKTALSPAEAHLNISVTSPFAKATRSGNPMHAGTRYRRAGCQEGKQL